MKLLKEIQIRKKSKPVALAFLMFILNLGSAYSQFNQVTTVTGCSFGRTNTVAFDINAVGIGNFTSMPSAAFHINTNLLASCGVFSAGSVFRTDGPQNDINSWKLFTGSGASSLERGMIFNNGTNPVVADRSNFQLQATNGHMTFHAGTGPIGIDGIRPEWMRIASTGNVGIRTTNPQNTLEINSTVGGTSGLRFSQLNSASGVQTQNGKVLSVNANGDVILVNDNSGTPVTASNGLTKSVNDIQLGGVLSKNTEIDLNGFNLVFNKLGNAGNIALGLDVPPVSKAKLHVRSVNDPYAAKFESSFSNIDNVVRIDYTGSKTWTPALFCNNSNASGIGGSFRSGGIALQAIGSGGTSCGGIVAEANFGASNLGVAGRANSSVSGANNTGVEATAFGNGSWINTGVSAWAHGSAQQSNKAVFAVAKEASVNYAGEFFATDAANINYGVKANGRDANINYGIFSEASSAQNGSGTNNYGILAQVISGGATNYGGYFRAFSVNTNYGVYAEGSTFAGYFNGNVTVNGIFSNPSDKKLKENIKEVNNAVSLIRKMNPKTYFYKDFETSGVRLPKGKQYGLIAQELESILPESVTEILHPAEHDASGKKIRDEVIFKGINYISLIPLLIQGMKEQQEMIEQQKEEIEKLKRERTSQPSEISDDSKVLSHKVAALYQNKPNPFSESTVITYSIPHQAGDASILLFDMQGIMLKKISLPKGESSVTISAGELQAGMYLYSLIVDGQEVDTKRMILTR